MDDRAFYSPLLPIGSLGDLARPEDVLASLLRHKHLSAQLAQVLEEVGDPKDDPCPALLLHVACVYSTGTFCQLVEFERQ